MYGFIGVICFRIEFSKFKSTRLGVQGLLLSLNEDKGIVNILKFSRDGSCPNVLDLLFIIAIIIIGNIVVTESELEVGRK